MNRTRPRQQARARRLLPLLLPLLILAVVLLPHISRELEDILAPPIDPSTELGALPTGPLPTDRPYDRDEFGQRWADTDHSGCDTRNQVLALALQDVVYRTGTRDCVVESGWFLDPYTGEGPVLFVKGDDGGDVAVDHLVPLAHAWQMGAAGWDEDRRELFANDIAGLQPTFSSVNSSKGDSTPLEWLPPDPAYLCTYLDRWVDTKIRWQLAVTEQERSWLAEQLHECDTATASRSTPSDPVQSTWITPVAVVCARRVPA